MICRRSSCAGWFNHDPPPTFGTVHSDDPTTLKEISMPKQTERVAAMETKAFPPPPHKVALGFQQAGNPEPPYPDHFGPDDVFITVVGIEPRREMSS